MKALTSTIAKSWRFRKRKFPWSWLSLMKVRFRILLGSSLTTLCFFCRKLMVCLTWWTWVDRDGTKWLLFNFFTICRCVTRNLVSLKSVLFALKRAWSSWNTIHTTLWKTKAFPPESTNKKSNAASICSYVRFTPSSTSTSSLSSKLSSAFQWGTWSYVTNLQFVIFTRNG